MLQDENSTSTLSTSAERQTIENSVENSDLILK